jgi:pimeloyl-ACP methyl ester carboxylesterase
VLAFGVIELIRPQPPIQHPTLIITCENDSGSTPAMSQAIAGEISGGQVIVVPHLRHMGLVENPSFFINAIAEFLEDE